MTFSAYNKLISSEARSIGIITGPFDVEKKNDTAPQPRNQQERAEDTTELIQDRCRRVVLAFVDYLQARHPNSRVSVRNGKKETVQSSYVRLVMANQTIVGTSSTFAIFPAIASFGTGYLSSGYRNSSLPARTRWMIDEFGQVERPVDNVVLVEDDERANVGVIKQLWETEGADAVLAFFSR